MQQAPKSVPAYVAGYYDRVPVPSPWRGKLADFVAIQKRLQRLR